MRVVEDDAFDMTAVAGQAALLKALTRVAVRAAAFAVTAVKATAAGAEDQAAAEARQVAELAGARATREDAPRGAAASGMD